MKLWVLGEDFFFIFPLFSTFSLQVLNVLPLGLCVNLKLISPLWMIYKALKNLVVQAPIDITIMTCKIEYG
jgi:hypothetical protein